MSTRAAMTERLVRRPCPDCGAVFAVDTYAPDCVLVCRHAATCPELARRGVGIAELYAVERGRSLTLVYDVEGDAS